MVMTHDTISMLYGTNVVLCKVHWRRFVTLFK